MTMALSYPASRLARYARKLCISAVAFALALGVALMVWEREARLVLARFWPRDLAWTTLNLTPAPWTSSPEELDILEAVFRYQFEHNASSATALNRAKYYFIAIGERETPTDLPAELLVRFSGHSPPVEPASLADTSGIVRHTGDGGQGIVLRVESIERIDADTVRVRGGYYEANRSASGSTYRVERRDGKWTVVDDVMNWIS